MDLGTSVDKGTLVSLKHIPHPPGHLDFCTAVFLRQ